MSQSATSTGEAVNNAGVTAEFGKLMNRGGSLSGRERHCVFLNLGAAGGGTPQFANLSAGSGLDLPDDGRAIALTDWDGDGDVDLWISNRNAPRLRFMRNDTPAGNHFLSLRLQGTGRTGNRDAIGARVEIVTSDGGRSIRTLHAGEGYLAQSSKEILIGLGRAEAVEKLIVRWPDRDGTVEEFGGLSVDQRYRLVQGEGQALPPEPTRSGLALKPSSPTLPPVRETARIPLVTLVPIPGYSFSGADGRSVRLGAGKPVLLNLWASWCAPCLAELAEIRDRKSEIRAAGIEVVALSVDGLDDGADPAALKAAIAKLRFPFVMGAADDDLVGLLQWHHDASVGLGRALPVPSSFLIDAAGRVAVIYKGPVSVDDLLADVGHSQGTRAERWLRSAQISGRTIDHEIITRTADDFEAAAHFQHGMQRESLGDLDRAVGHYRESLGIRPAFALAQRNVGRLLAKRGDWAGALPHFASYVESRAQDPAGHHALGLAHQHLGNLAQARDQFEATVRLQANHVPALEALGGLQLLAGQTAEAIDSFRSVLELAPDYSSALNNLAWILATHPDDAIRNADEALRLAIRLVGQTDGKKPEHLDTLAVAQAASGRFEAAITTARQAVSLARAAGQEKFTSQIQDKIDLYQRGQPYREREQAPDGN